MIREKLTDPWRELSWETAIAHVAFEFKRIQAKYGRLSVGGITSSRCMVEEIYLAQKLIRGGFTPPAAMRRSITTLASPSTARARRRSWASPISSWPPAI